MSIGSHTKPHRGTKDEWLTPPAIIEALGPFDLDPCAPIERPWPTASRHLTIEDDGLRQDWSGFVWLNPPYGPETWVWLEKLSQHPGGGIALTFARTETKGFCETIWKRASGLLFLEGRLTFHHVDGTPGPGNSGGPSVLVAYGRTAWNRLHCCELPGAFASNWEFLGKARGYGISTENTTERPEDAARRFAGKVIELQAQLATKDAEIARLTNELTAKQVELEALEEGMIAAHESETIILNELATKDAEIEDWRVRTIKVTNELADTALTVTRLEAENKRLREVFTELLEDHAQTVDGEWGSGNGELKQQIIEDWGAKILAPDKEGK